MQTLAICPRCHQLLVNADEDPNLLVCHPCEGRFLVGDRGSETDIIPDQIVEPSWISCPGCLMPMTPLSGSPEQAHHCQACFGKWFEPQSESLSIIQPPPTQIILVTPEVEALPSFAKKILYSLSLPERTLRSAIGVAAGTTRELASLIVPMAFQSSKSYEVAIRNSLNFLTETIGGFGDEKTAANEAGEHIARKTVGNFVDLASLAMLHISPMWTLAVVSDVAYGSSVYLKELATELRAQGIIDETSSINNVDDFLSAMQKATGDAATTLDRPPFSMEELQTVVAQTRESLSKADLRKLVPETEVTHYWESLNSVATRDHVTMLDAATAVAMHTAEQASVITHSAVTGVKVAGNLFEQNVFQHYRVGLQKLHDEGFLQVVASTYTPYVSRIWENYAEDKQSWTEALLDPENVTKVLNWRPDLSSLWGKSEK